MQDFDRCHRVTRRTFLRGAGVAMALPWLDAMTPGLFARAASPKPWRMVVVYNDMGFMPQFFFPEQAGRDYALTPYLETLKDFRKDFTVFSGVSHPGVDGGHAADICFLTGAPHPGSGGFRNTISLDQYAAERIGVHTRFPHLNLIVGNELNQSLSWTSNGVRLPPEQKPSVLFKRLFLQGNPQQVEAQVRQLREGRSILDVVADRAQSLERSVNAGDRGRLDQYFTAVRELEGRMVKAEEWERRPKPTVNVAPPRDNEDRNDTLGRSRLMFDMVRLALQTDSTRLITIMVQDGGSTHNVAGGDQHHNLTHHGSRPEVVGKLRQMEEGQLKVLNELLTALRNTPEDGETLLDRTMVLSGAGMGNANAHSNSNLPVLLAGGGFKHGQHLVFDKHRNYPLANLYVSMLQRLGIEADQFATSTGTMRDLEMI
ncbi:MAG: DUF1552 domain-containing protein [Planctomycetia bacterium]|nr:DUF1552 domain-containing protein [Planctomycetia bacterium]